MWSLQQSTKQEILDKVEATLGSQVCTDPFACRQSTVAPRFTTPLYCRQSTSFNGLLLDWSQPFSVCLNPPWHLLPRVLEKARASRARGILVHPYAPSGHRKVIRQSSGATVDSGLRLCVKDEVLQLCVLLATQGTHSRIWWSSSQECQHVISSDIRPYDRKLLGTSSVFQQEMTLPANFMMRSISSAVPDFEAAVRLLQGGRRPSTVKSYDQKWLKFETFTSQAQDDTSTAYV